MIAVVSLETAEVNTVTDAVDDPAGTVTDGGIAIVGVSLVNVIGVGSDAGAFSEIFTVEGAPPFTARGSRATFTNEVADEVGCVGDSTRCRPEFPSHEAKRMAISHRKRPLSTVTP